MIQFCSTSTVLFSWKENDEQIRRFKLYFIKLICFSKYYFNDLRNGKLTQIN